MSKNGNYVNWGFDHRDYRHIPAALRAEQRVNLPHVFDQFPPRLAGQVAQLGRGG